LDSLLQEVKNDVRTQRKHQGTFSEIRTIERVPLTLPKKKKGLRKSRL